jgi:nucleoid-associated protein YgaU
VEEVNIPYAGKPPEGAEVVSEGKYVEEKEEKVESPVKVSSREYVIKKDDSLWKIAQNELGSGHRWKYLYEMNKDKIKNPKKLKAGTRIMIPVE